MSIDSRKTGLTRLNPSSNNVFTIIAHYGFIPANNSANNATSTATATGTAGATSPQASSQQKQLPNNDQAAQQQDQVEITYSDLRTIGNGSFGVVFQATLQKPTHEQVAIKKVLQDKRFKNRELQIMRKLDHCNVVKLKYFFHSMGERGNSELYLHLVLEYVPETLYKIARTHSRSRQNLPMILVKLYMYQLFRSLNYIHSMDICHRDIKPQNLLLNPDTGVLKLCDFGSAKSLVGGEPNVAYICSRYYRAPELIFGATDYTTKIDIWSAGCVMAELILGEPMFPGESGVDQLVEIIKVLGTPTREQMKAMNPNYTEFRFPVIKARSWNRVFSSHLRTPPEAAKLVSNLLEYTPSNRLTPLSACAHPFFDELRSPSTKLLPNGREFPPLFNFSEDELRKESHLLPKLLPQNQISDPMSQQRNTSATSTNTSSLPTSSSSNITTNIGSATSTNTTQSISALPTNPSNANSSVTNNETFTSNRCNSNNDDSAGSGGNANGSPRMSRGSNTGGALNRDTGSNNDTSVTSSTAQQQQHSNQQQSPHAQR